MMIRTCTVKIVIAALLVLTCAPCLGADPARYEITMPEDSHRVVLVSASLLPDGPAFYMLPGANQLPERWATFVSDVEVHDEDGRPVPVVAGDDATWRLSRVPKGRVTVRYRVSLDHEQHDWNGGVDGAAYWREWGVFFTARSLFILSGEARDDIAVTFDLPTNWRVTTPWQSTSDDNRQFIVADHHELANSMFFAGTHREVPVRHGPFEFLLALGGPDILALEDVLTEMAGGILGYYVDVMGDVPRLDGRASLGKPVVIINQASATDGEAIGNNISILLEPSGDPMAQHISRLIFAHEFFHLWNGKSFAPDGEHSEWFKEGFSNFYTLKALRHIGYLTDESYLQMLAGLFYARYKSDDAVGRLSMTNGELKHDHWGLIYAGGLLVAIAQDLKIRTATGNRKSLDDMMRFMFNEHSGVDYDLGNIQDALSQLNDTSQEDFFRRYIYGTEEVPIAEFLALAGIDTTEANGRIEFRIRENPEPVVTEIRQGFFGGPGD